MAFGLDTQNIKLFGMVAFGLAFLSLIFIPINQWGFVVDWVVQTPLIIIIGQSIFFLMAVAVITLFLIMIREMIG